MKTLRTLFVIAIAVVGFNSKSFAQLSLREATVKASGEVVTGLSIDKTGELAFGKFAVNEKGGTVAVAASVGATAVVTDGVTKQGGSSSPALFTVSGYADATYTVTKPDEITLKHGADDQMTVTLSYSTDVFKLSSGSQSFYVGGTLTVGANQPVGVYENTEDLKVTVDYN